MSRIRSCLWELSAVVFRLASILQITRTGMKSKFDYVQNQIVQLGVTCPCLFLALGSMGKLLDQSWSNLICSITGQREKLPKVFRQIGLYQLGTISVKFLVSVNACVCLIYDPPTAKVIWRRSQFIVSSERLYYKSSNLTTRPRRLLNSNAFYV